MGFLAADRDKLQPQLVRGVEAASPTGRRWPASSTTQSGTEGRKLKLG